MARVRVWWLPVTLLLLLAGVALGLGLRRPLQDPVRDHAVTRTNPWGTRALAELAGRHGLAVTPWRRPLTLLRPTDHALWLLDPSRPVPEGEVRATLDWVRQGGDLLLGVDLEETHNLLALDLRGPSPDERLLAALGLRGLAAGPVAGLAYPTTAAAPTREVRALYVPGPHRLAGLSAADLADRNRPLHRAGGASPPLRVLIRPAWMTLVADPAGAVLLQARHGRGRITVLAEVEVLSNANLSRADNVVLAANLLFTGSDRVLFAEHLHRLGSGRSADAEALDPSRTRATLLLALLALVLYFAGRMQRFGAPQPLLRSPRRSALEFVGALADLYRRAEARGAVLDILRQAFRQRLAAAVGLPPGTDAPALAAAVADRHGLPAPPLTALLAQLDTPATLVDVTEDRLLHLAKLMADYEEAVTHGR